MLEEKSSRASSSTGNEFSPSLPVEELQIVTQDLLTLLSELSQTQTIITTTKTNQTLIQLLLHIMTDLETQLSIARDTLEREHLIDSNIEITHR
ncbi:MAG: hypothetical protein ACXADY_15940 [Candidatus Hodarchaeales archaeon]|jgi:hypothetical protein